MRRRRDTAALFTKRSVYMESMISHTAPRLVLQIFHDAFYVRARLQLARASHTCQPYVME